MTVNIKELNVFVAGESGHLLQISEGACTLVVSSIDALFFIFIFFADSFVFSQEYRDGAVRPEGRKYVLFILEVARKGVTAATGFSPGVVKQGSILVF